MTSQNWMQNRWHNTRNVELLLEGNLQEVQDPPENKWLNSQFILTPAVGGPPDVISAILGRITLQPIAMTGDLYRNCIIDKFIRTNVDKKWNIVMLDCIDRCPFAVHYLICLNVTTELKVLFAVCQGGGSQQAVDVTSKVQSFVGRNRVLYLTHLTNDLELLRAKWATSMSSLVSNLISLKRLSSRRFRAWVGGCRRCM
jgi:hypothetical protein